MNSLTNDNKYVQQFYRDVKVRLEKDDDIMQNATNLAFRDMCRTMRGFSKCPKKQLLKDAVSHCLKLNYTELVKSPKLYAKYDDWHQYVCHCLVAIFVAYDCLCATYLSIGQAQKWLNMFMKYMFLEDERLNQLLPYLHIPIDNVILDAFAKFHLISSSLNKALRPWSRINDYNLYYSLQINIRIRFRAPLLAEFCLWQMQNYPQKSSRYSLLTEFTEYFADTNQKFYDVDEPTPIPQQQIVSSAFPQYYYPKYTNACGEFLSIIPLYYQQNFSKLLHSRGIYGTNIKDASKIDFVSEDADFILAILYIVNTNNTFGGDFFDAQLLNYFAKSGAIHNMLQRLRELDSQ